MQVHAFLPNRLTKILEYKEINNVIKELNTASAANTGKKPSIAPYLKQKHAAIVEKKLIGAKISLTECQCAISNKSSAATSFLLRFFSESIGTPMFCLL